MKKCLGQGRTRGFRSLLRASRPQPGEHPQALGGGPGRGAASGQGCREEVPARGRAGRGGGPGLKAPSRGAAAVRAGGSQLRGEDTGSCRGSEVSAWVGSSVPAAGAPGGGLSGCTLHWATPAPSLQQFGVTGMGPSLQQPISGRPGARARSRKPSPGWVGLAGGGDLIGWSLPPLLLIPSGTTPSPAVKPTAQSRQLEEAWPSKLGLVCDWLHSLTPPVGFPAVASKARP